MIRDTDEDYTLNVCPTTKSVNRLLRFMRGIWPDLLVENDKPGTLIIYKDEQAKSEWDRLGCVEGTEDQAMLIILRDNIHIAFSGSDDSAKLIQSIETDLMSDY